MKKIAWIIGLLAVGTVVYFWATMMGKPAYYFGQMSSPNETKEFVSPNMKTLSYWIHLEYPAQEAVDFYEKRMLSKGWTPVAVKDPGLQRKWFSQLRYTGIELQPAVCVFKYTAAWSNRERTRLTNLELLYLHNAPKRVCSPVPENDVLYISVQELPF